MAVGDALPGRCVLALALVGLLPLVSHAQTATSDTRQKWATESKTLIAGLRDLAEASAEREERASTLDVEGDASGSLEATITELLPLAQQGWNASQEADDILWKLWLVTGMPPSQGRQGESASAFWMRNASEYRKFVARHAALTEEQIGRLGLENAVRTLGSPLWYSTKEYLVARTGVRFDAIIFIEVFPSRHIIEEPLTPAAYDQLSAALAEWLTTNRDVLTWDETMRRFRPRHGEFVNTRTLSNTLLRASDLVPTTKSTEQGGDEESENNNGS